MAFSFTFDLGCEYGGGVSCFGNRPGGPKQSFIGFMFYNRFWFHHDLFGLTIGGGGMNNPGRYLVLVPPINGATAISGTPYFTANPGDPFKAWDVSGTFDYMPKQYVTFRFGSTTIGRECSVLCRAGWSDSSGRKHGHPGLVCCQDLRRICARTKTGSILRCW